MTEITLRVLNEADVDQLRIIRLEALKNDQIYFIQPYEEELTRKPSWYAALIKNHTILGAFIGEELCGLSIMTIQEYDKVNHKAYTWFTYVKPEKRGYGIARKIRLFTFEEARRQDLIQLKSTVLAINEPIRKLNLSLGCQEVWTEYRGIQHEGKYYDLVHTMKYFYEEPK